MSLVLSQKTKKQRTCVDSTAPGSSFSLGSFFILFVILIFIYLNFVSNTNVTMVGCNEQFYNLKLQGVSFAVSLFAAF